MLQSWAPGAVAPPTHTTSTHTANPAAPCFCKPFCKPSIFLQTLLQTLHAGGHASWSLNLWGSPWMTSQVEDLGWNPRMGFGVDILGRKSVGNLHSDILLGCGQGHPGSCSHIYSQALAYYLACRKGSISLCWNELKLNFKFRGTLSKGRLPVTIVN